MKYVLQQLAYIALAALVMLGCVVLLDNTLSMVR
jgi:hypothetical protein